MKVQRYPIGQTILRELSGQRESAITPREAAQSAAAPYEAVAAVAGEGAKTAAILKQKKDMAEAELKREQEREKALRDRKDQIHSRLAGEKLRLRLKQFQERPEWNQEVQADGTYTPDAMREAWEQESAEFVEEVNAGFLDQNNAGRFGEFLDVARQIGAVDINKAAQRKSDQFDTDKLYDARELALESGDFESAKEYEQTLLDLDYISEPQFRALSAQSEGVRKENIAELATLEARQVAVQGDEEATAAHLDHIINEQKFPDEADREIAISATIAEIRNQATIRKTRDQAQMADIALGVTGLKEAMDMGVDVDTETWLETALAQTDPSQAMQIRNWYAELRTYRAGASNVRDNVTEVYVSREQGVPLENTKTNREAVQIAINQEFDAWMERQAEEGIIPSSEEKLRFQGMQAVSFGIVPQDKWKMMINGSTPDHYLNALPYYQAITQDLSSVPQGIDMQNEKIQTLAYLDSVYSVGSDMTDLAMKAIELVEQYQGLSQDERDNRTTQLYGDGGIFEDDDKDDLQEAYEEYFKEPLSESYGIDEDELFKTDEMDVDVRSEFKKHFETHYNIYQDQDAAGKYAGKVLSNVYTKSNINGDWATERKGIPGNTRPMAKEFINEFIKEGGTFVVDAEYDNLDAVVLKGEDIDPSKITFMNPRRLGNEWTYDLGYEGTPLLGDDLSPKQAIFEARDIQRNNLRNQYKALRENLITQAENNKTKIRNKEALANQVASTVTPYQTQAPINPPSDTAKIEAHIDRNLEAELRELDKEWLPLLSEGDE